MTQTYSLFPTRRSAKGFGLIELMISMVLGLLVLGAAIAVFQSNQRTYSANEGLNRIQENARVAFELMSRDLRAAGGSACSNLARPDAEHILTARETAFLNVPVTSASPPTEFTVIAGDDTAYRIASSTTTSITLDAGQVDDATEAFRTGDWLVLCNANKLYVVEAGAVTSTTVVYTPATPVPLTADPLSPNASVMLARYRSTRWYRDGTTLRVSRQGGAGEAVAEGVQDMAVSYLQAGNSSYLPTPTDWNAVTAVRMDLTFVGQSVDGNALTRTASNVVSLRSRTL